MSLGSFPFLEEAIVFYCGFLLMTAWLIISSRGNRKILFHSIVFCPARENSSTNGEQQIGILNCVPRLFLYPETFWRTFKGALFFFEFSRLKYQNFYGEIALFLFPFLVFEFDILIRCPSRWLLDWLDWYPSRDQLHASIQVTWHFFLYSRTVMDELNLCDPDWLHAQLDCPQPRILLLDCRSHVEYSQKGHVTSAINIQLPALMLKRLTKGSLSVPAVIKCQQARVSEASFPKLFILPRFIIYVLSALSNLGRVFFYFSKFSRTSSWLTGKPTGFASTMRYDFHT